MNPDTLTLARQHLIATLQAQNNPTEARNPRRQGWEFTAQHILRVEALTVKILARQQHELDENQVNLIRLAAILHDIGRYELVQTKGHAATGALMARNWMTAHPELDLSDADVERVVEIIADHSNKGKPDPDLGRAVLKDADTLDGIGAMSIFTTASELKRESPFFLQVLVERLEDVEIPYCTKKMETLITEGAQEILWKKKSFLQGFVRQLRDELEMQDGGLIE